MRTLRLSLVAILTLALVGGTPALVMAQGEVPADPSDEGMGLLPGLEFVTEEIEPGVYRVTSDGVRELTWPIELSGFGDWLPPGPLHRMSAQTTADIVASEAGVWLRRPEGILRLGEADPVWEAKAEERVPDFTVTVPDFTVTSDGTLYLLGGPVRVLREGNLEKVGTPARELGFAFVRDVKVGPDGTLWALGRNDGKAGRDLRWWFARRDADGWSRVKWASRAWKSGVRDWVPGADGGLYVRRGPAYVEDVMRLDGQRWEELERPEGSIRDLMVGTDGTIWLRASAPGGEPRYLRAGTDGWTAHDADPSRLPGLADDVVAADGALWYTAIGEPLVNGGCDGVVRTDGTTATRFLEDRCVHDLAVGPEGTVWATATWWFGDYYSPESVSPVEVFAITPEAVAASE